MLGPDLREARELLPARRAPGRPEVHGDHLAAELRDVHRAAAEVREGERRRGVASPVPPRGCALDEELARHDGGHDEERGLRELVHVFRPGWRSIRDSPRHRMTRFLK
jgi:hypothetical protein